MTVPEPQNKQEWLAKWRSRGHIVVPGKAGILRDLIIVYLAETTALNGRPLDFLISAQLTRNDPANQFGVIFSDKKPDSGYPIPVLWYTHSCEVRGWLKPSN